MSKTERKNEPVNKIATEEDSVSQKIDYRTILITIDSCTNVAPLFPISDTKVKCTFLGKELGETSSIPITDDITLIINESFEIEIDANCVLDVDNLISFPVYLTVIQTPGIFDESLYAQLRECEVFKTCTKSIDSFVSIYEAYTGDKVDGKVKISKDKKKKKGKGGDAKPPSKKSRSDSKSSKGSKKSVTNKTKNESKSSVSKLPVTYGMCVLDLLPLFFGKTTFGETLLVNPTVEQTNIFSTYKHHPKLSVTVSVKENIAVSETANILYFTVESIYNIPSLMKPDMEYRVCAMLPQQNSSKVPLIMNDPMWVDGKPSEEVFKCWPGIKKDGNNANTTKYKIDMNFENVKTKIHPDDIQSAFQYPRLEFNYIKRNLLMQSGLNYLGYHFEKFRKLVLEIYITPKSKGAPTPRDQATEKSSKSTDVDKSKTKQIAFLHLMAIIDVSRLIYPGISQLRVAVPLRTFSFHEASKLGGLDDSFFAPQPPQDQGGAASSKMEKDTGKKKDKKEKGGKDKHGKTGDMKSQLPPKPEPPAPPEPSIEVYNDDGKQCFIIVEIEMCKPIREKRPIEDIVEEMEELLSTIPDAPKIVLDRCVTKKFFKETVDEITRDMHQKYQTCSELRTLDHQKFLKHLQKIGAYETYLASFNKAIAFIVTNQFKMDEEQLKNSKVYHNYVSNIYHFLVSEVNKVLNTVAGTGVEINEVTRKTNQHQLFIYAKEKSELRNYCDAKRYYLERICHEENTKADYWFDYAVYHLEQQEDGVALECIKEALNLDSKHKYSLLILGALLANDNKKIESETCLLDLMANHPRWLEGWVFLCLYYFKFDQEGGYDMAYQNALKYLDHNAADEYFAEFQDLAWTTANLPNTMFFRAAIVLLKLRLFNWAELALAQEITNQEHYGHVHYMLAAIYYYRKQYEHALEHLEETNASYGSDYAVFALKGHVLLALERYGEAKKNYYRVLESYNRPDFVPLVYVTTSLVQEKLGDYQESRKLILLACKFSPSAYTWYKAGVLYLLLNDLLSAEECLSEANIRDPRCPLIWAYLALVNLKLNRTTEAEQCYQEAIKNNLDDEEVLDKLKNEFADKEHCGDVL